MQSIETIPGKTYAVTTADGCTVYRADGSTLLKAIDAGQGYFVAIEGKVCVDDDGADVRPFDLAPQQKLALMGVLLLGGNAGGLPAGYTRVEYLESTNTQYIDTGFLSKAFLDVPIKTFIAPIRDTWDYFGTYHSGGLSLQMGSASGPKLSFTFFSTSSINYAPVELNRFYQVILSKEGVSVDGQNIGVPVVSPETSILNTADRFLLFARFNFGNKAVEGAWMKLKTVEALPLFNMVSALDPAGAPCMYDTVSRKPFYNQGTGAFIAGVENQVQLNNMLRKLPDRTGQDVGTLQVRLADELQTPENEAKLDAMRAKNWEISQAA